MLQVQLAYKENLQSLPAMWLLPLFRQRTEGVA